MRKSDPSKNESEQTASFDSPGHVRNLCFVWPDGKMKFLNYAYLVSGEYNNVDETIELIFTSDKVKITGTNLSILFDQLYTHSIKRISYLDSRYASLDETSKFAIENIEVEKV